MHEIIFYTDSNGCSPVGEYLQALQNDSGKQARTQFDRIGRYLEQLSLKGTQVGMPFVRHLDGEIWELRPMRDRILFFAWTNGSYVLLHVFMKKTQKTPPREIERAKRELKDWIERNE